MTTYDVIVYGATGFTGRQAAQWFGRHAPDDLRWAVAGRNEHKLKEVAQETGAHGQIVADSSRAETVDAMVRQARVLATTAGPFARYGDPVVDACVKHGVHYVDITGETVWAKRVIERHHETAKANGTKIVPFCGFDSVPSDLGVLATVRHIEEQYGEKTRHVSASFAIRGGFNGGTLASAIAMAESGDSRQMGKTFLLNPPGWTPSDAVKKASRDVRDVRYDETRKKWLGPFLMAAINTRVVRRSAALMEAAGVPYGPEFTYRETMEHRSKAAAWGVTAGLGAFEKVVQSSTGRSLVKKFGPSPGEGPSKDAMDGGFMRVRLVGEGTGTARVMTTWMAKGDPGNRVTVNILCASALLLAQAPDDLPEGGGVLTPATAMGFALIDRLSALGFEMDFEPLT